MSLVQNDTGERMRASRLELLPCPFCGGPAEMVHNHHGNGEFSVWCKKVLTCGIHGCAWPTGKDAAAVWNTRAHP